MGHARRQYCFFFQGIYEPFATIPNIEGVINEQIQYGKNRDVLTYSKRVFLLPGANLLVTVPKGNDRLILHQVDMNQLLAQSPIDYLLVVSTAPTKAVQGQKLTYRIDARAKNGGLRFNVDSGPPGMAVSAQGELTWAVPIDHPGGDENVIISVRDSAGQEIFHTLRLQIAQKQ